MSNVPALTLNITVNRARNLPDERVGIFGTQDPYCVLSIERPRQTVYSSTSARTRSIRHGDSNPKWGEAFQLRLPHARMNFLSVRVVNDNVVLDTDISDTKIPVYALLHGKVVEGWFPLYGSGGQSGGEILLRLQVTGNIQAYLNRLNNDQLGRVTSSFATSAKGLKSAIARIMLRVVRKVLKDVEDEEDDYLSDLLDAFLEVDDDEFGDEDYEEFEDFDDDDDDDEDEDDDEEEPDDEEDCDDDDDDDDDDAEYQSSEDDEEDDDDDDNEYDSDGDNDYDDGGNDYGGGCTFDY